MIVLPYLLGATGKEGGVTSYPEARGYSAVMLGIRTCAPPSVFARRLNSIKGALAWGIPHGTRKVAVKTRWVKRIVYLLFSSSMPDVTSVARPPVVLK